MVETVDEFRAPSYGLLMTENERGRYRQALLSMKTEILQDGGVKIEPNRRDPTVVGGDEDEQPLNEMHQAIASGRNRARAGSLAQIESALHRITIDPELFGLCQECEEEIDARRLRVMPYAELCTECQQKKDGPRHPATRRHLTDYK